MMGEDKDNQLPDAKMLALKYMPGDSEIEISNEITIECNKKTS